MRIRTWAAVCAIGLCGALPAHAQDGAFGMQYPYDGTTAPLDFSKIAWGSTPAESCAQRSASELLRQADSPFAPIVFVGWLPNSQCGYQWVNLCCGAPGALLNNGDAVPQFFTCNQIAGMSADVPRPAWCTMQCPADQKNAQGVCRVAGGKDPGPPCPFCGNPVNPGTGNKFEAQLDYAGAGPGALRFERFYNSGLPSVERALGKFWQHTYTRKILQTSPTQVTAYRADGKRFQFTLRSGAWVPDGDVADTLAQSLDPALHYTTGWRYQVAADDSVESYDGSGNPTSIRSRSGLVQSFVYSDGSDGAASGRGGFFLDAAGNPTPAVLPAKILLRVADHFGRPLAFGYDARLRIVKLTDPSGGAALYGYDAKDNIVSVTYPGGARRVYVYNEAALNGGVDRPNLLTGIVDENGQRFASFEYDASGRAIVTTHHAGGTDVERYRLAYPVSGAQTSVVDPLGTVRGFGFQTVLGAVKNTALSQPERGATTAATAYDANGNVASRADFNGNVANYSYDLARNLETSRTEAVGTPQARTIATRWHPIFRLRAAVAEPLRITSYVYNGDGGARCGVQADGATLVPGAMCSKTVQPTTDATGAAGFGAAPAGPARTWTYTYDRNGSVLTVDGPRSDVADVTTYAHYANDDPDLGKRGNVATVANALGHVTSITAYNGAGQPTAIVDPNGLVTTLAYDARQRLVARSVGGETTAYEYDPAGQLAKVTLPDGSFVAYTYDGAHRLTGVSDAQGNRIAYTLDAMGNRVREQVLDPLGSLAQTRSRAFDSLSRLAQEIGAQDQTTAYAYDAQGNVVSVTDPLGHLTANGYDALNRLVQVTDPALGVTRYAYDGIDQLTGVTDPRGLATSYAYDGLSNLNRQVSPDTGTTSSTYDAAGNLLAQTDAKGQTTSYTYDALNRVASIAFADGSRQVYTYDRGPNALGRLAQITEIDAGALTTSELAYAYDAHGHVVSETRTLAGRSYATAYRYDAAGRLVGTTYPSGRQIAYALDPLGRIASVATAPPGGAAQDVALDVAYQPFGGVRGYTLGNGQPVVRGYDQDGRIASYNLAGKTFAIGYDAAGRVGFIADAASPASANSYGYDALDRLTSAVIPGNQYSYAYDAVGNRISKTVGSATDTYAYSAASNRIARITAQAGAVRNFLLDANGSTTDDGVNRYAYDARGRMAQSVGALGTTAYQVNALGQRVRKTGAGDDRVFHYDTKGRLIAESDPDGKTRREYIWLGDIPLAVVQ